MSWQSIIAGDVDGTTSTPYRIDQSAPNLNRYSATRRVARTIFMGTAPTHQQQNTGLDDKQINLGVVQPGERPAIFGDALRRLTGIDGKLLPDMGAIADAATALWTTMTSPWPIEELAATATLRVCHTLNKPLQPADWNGAAPPVAVHMDESLLVRENTPLPVWLPATQRPIMPELRRPELSFRFDRYRDELTGGQPPYDQQSDYGSNDDVNTSLALKCNEISCQ